MNSFWVLNKIAAIILRMVLMMMMMVLRAWVDVWWVNILATGTEI